MIYVSDDTNSLLNELMSSKKVVDTSRGPIWFEFPYADDRLYAAHLYEKSKREYEEQGIPSIEEARAEHLEYGLWTNEQEKLMQEILPKFIEQLQERLEAEKNLARKRRIKEKIAELNHQLVEITTAYNTLMANTSDFMGYRVSIAFMVWRCFRDVSGNRIWERYEDILSEQDIDFVEDLITAYNLNEEVGDMSTLRKIARSPEWRVRWKCSENNVSSLFGRQSKDMTIGQFMLVYWSQMYDSVYDSLERPPQSVIEDDEALDKWLTQRSEEMERDIAQKFEGKSNTVKNSKIDSAPEVFRVVSGYYNDEGQYILYTDEERWEQIEKMRGLNTEHTRAVQRATEEKLKETPGVPQAEQLVKNKHGIEATGGTVTVKQGKGLR